MLITFLSSNQDLRIPSFVLHSKKYSNDIIVIDDTADNLELYTSELEIIHYKNKKALWMDAVKSNIFDHGLILINLDEKLSLVDVDFILSQDFSNLKDIQVNFFSENDNTFHRENDVKEIISTIMNFENISWIYFSKEGIDNFQHNDKIDNLDLFGFNSIKYPESKKKTSVKKIFEYKFKSNPLIYFGIPGLFLMFSSLFLVINVVSKYQSIDSVSMGTAIITISTTVLGILSIMAAIISFIFGKQTEFILTNYSD